MLTKTFWIAALERAIKSAAQAAILAIGADQVGYLTDLSTATAVLYATLSGFILSILTSVASAAMTDGNPSVGSAEVLAEAGVTADPIAGEPVEVEPKHAATESNGAE